MKKILIATKNTGKVREFQSILQGAGIDLVSIADLESDISQPEETGSTFEENALLKASYYAVESGMPCLADDSGLEVDALDKRPGVFSARYVEGSDEDRYTKVLEEMEGRQNRTARFVCVVAYADPVEDREETFQGTVEGSIASNARGSHGFGYDPIFVPNGYDQTMAELGDQVKNTISHRAKALEKFRAWFVTQPDTG